MSETYWCPECGRHGMAWDGRAKVLMCHYWSCSHVIRGVKRRGAIPTPVEIAKAIQWDKDNK